MSNYSAAQPELQASGDPVEVVSALGIVGSDDPAGATGQFPLEIGSLSPGEKNLAPGETSIVSWSEKIGSWSQGDYLLERKNRLQETISSANSNYSADRDVTG